MDRYALRYPRLDLGYECVVWKWVSPSNPDMINPNIINLNMINPNLINPNRNPYGV